MASDFAVFESLWSGSEENGNPKKLIQPFKYFKLNLKNRFFHFFLIVFFEIVEKSFERKMYNKKNYEINVRKTIGLCDVSRKTPTKSWLMSLC